MENNNEVRLALLEHNMKRFEPLIGKLTEAIDKLNSLSADTSKILAVYDIRLSKINEFEKTININSERIDELEEKIENIQNWKSTVSGVVTFITFMISILGGYLWFFHR
jgi:predicted RNase H-like nuclease (RuvC/YqgF family)